MSSRLLCLALATTGCSCAFLSQMRPPGTADALSSAAESSRCVLPVMAAAAPAEPAHAISGGDSKPKKIFVLGGDGFCGWPTACHLSDKGHDVVIIDNLAVAHRDPNEAELRRTVVRRVLQRCLVLGLPLPPDQRAQRHPLFS